MDQGRWRSVSLDRRVGSTVEATDDGLDVGLGFQFVENGLAQSDIVGVGLVVSEVLGA